MLTSMLFLQCVMYLRHFSTLLSPPSVMGPIQQHTVTQSSDDPANFPEVLHLAFRAKKTNIYLILHWFATNVEPDSTLFF